LRCVHCGRPMPFRRATWG